MSVTEATKQMEAQGHFSDSFFGFIQEWYNFITWDLLEFFSSVG